MTTQEKIIQILVFYSEEINTKSDGLQDVILHYIGYEDQSIPSNQFEQIASEIAPLIDKRDAIIEAQKELYDVEISLSIIVSAMSNRETEFYYSPKYRELENDESDTIQKCTELRQKVEQLKSEI